MFCKADTSINDRQANCLRYECTLINLDFFPSIDIPSFQLFSNLNFCHRLCIESTHCLNSGWWPFKTIITSNSQFLLGLGPLYKLMRKNESGRLSIQHIHILSREILPPGCLGHHPYNMALKVEND